MSIYMATIATFKQTIIVQSDIDNTIATYIFLALSIFIVIFFLLFSCFCARKLILQSFQVENSEEPKLINFNKFEEVLLEIMKSMIQQQRNLYARILTNSGPNLELKNDSSQTYLTDVKVPEQVISKSFVECDIISFI